MIFNMSLFASKVFSQYATSFDKFPLTAFIMLSPSSYSELLSRYAYLFSRLIAELSSHRALVPPVATSTTEKADISRGLLAKPLSRSWQYDWLELLDWLDRHQTLGTKSRRLTSRDEWCSLYSRSYMGRILGCLVRGCRRPGRTPSPSPSPIWLKSASSLGLLLEFSHCPSVCLANFLFVIWVVGDLACMIVTVWRHSFCCRVLCNPYQFVAVFDRLHHAANLRLHSTGVSSLPQFFQNLQLV